MGIFTSHRILERVLCILLAIFYHLNPCDMIQFRSLDLILDIFVVHTKLEKIDLDMGVIEIAKNYYYRNI